MKQVLIHDEPARLCGSGSGEKSTFESKISRKDAKNRKDAKRTALEWLGASLLTCKIQLWLPVWPSSVVLPELTSYAVDIALRESTVVVSPRIHKTLGKAASEVISE